MYGYNEFDKAFLRSRAAQFRDQIAFASTTTRSQASVACSLAVISRIRTELLMLLPPRLLVHGRPPP
jgi:hypothetical protein